MSKLTAREIDTNLKSSPKFKKILCFDDYEYPVIPVSANTYKTGKHGVSKTRLLLRDFFENSIFSTIVDSSTIFHEMEEDGRFKLRSGLIQRIEGSNVEILNEDYELILIKESPEILPKCTLDSNVNYIVFEGTNLKYKIKSIDSVTVY